jgi:hypothetical protein
MSNPIGRHWLPAQRRCFDRLAQAVKVENGRRDPDLRPGSYRSMVTYCVVSLETPQIVFRRMRLPLLDLHNAGDNRYGPVHEALHVCHLRFYL